MMVAPEDANPLVQGSPQTGNWESYDVVLNYQYVYKPGTFKINYGGGAKRAYDQLAIWIRFFDAQGKFVETETVYNSGFREKYLPRRDSHEAIFEIPMESAQFSFNSMLKKRTSRR